MNAVETLETEIAIATETEIEIEIETGDGIPAETRGPDLPAEGISQCFAVMQGLLALAPADH